MTSKNDKISTVNGKKVMIVDMKNPSKSNKKGKQNKQTYQVEKIVNKTTKEDAKHKQPKVNLLVNSSDTQSESDTSCETSIDTSDITISNDSSNRQYRSTKSIETNKTNKINKTIKTNKTNNTNNTIKTNNTNKYQSTRLNYDDAKPEDPATIFEDADDIKKKLRFYKQVDEDLVVKLPLGTNIKYVEVLDDGSYKYKPGGSIIVNEAPEYLVLAGNRKTWSVQLANHVVFVEQFDLVRKNYETKIKKLRSQIEMLKQVNNKLCNEKITLVEENKKLNELLNPDEETENNDDINYCENDKIDKNKKIPKQKIVKIIKAK